MRHHAQADRNAQLRRQLLAHPRPRCPGDAAAAQIPRPRVPPADRAGPELGTAPRHPPPNTSAPSRDCTRPPPQYDVCPNPTREAAASSTPRPASSSPVSARPCRAEKHPIDLSYRLILLRRVAGFLMSPPDGFTLSPDKFHSNPRLTSCRRATATNEAPGCSVSATIRSFSSCRQRRRRSYPVMISIQPASDLNGARTSAPKITYPPQPG